MGAARLLQAPESPRPRTPTAAPAAWPRFPGQPPAGWAHDTPRLPESREASARGLASWYVLSILWLPGLAELGVAAAVLHRTVLDGGAPPEAMVLGLAGFSAVAGGLVAIALVCRALWLSERRADPSRRSRW
jgi:hypothetical protein